MRFNILIFSILICFYRTASSQDYGRYIQKYEDIAVSEMLRTGIPASIKLAQACLESNCGMSELACKANNHFGIKCGGDWSGKGFHKEDDDYREGQLVKSCFREFKSPEESFVAHSDFLTDPKKVQRYGSLFELKTTDYKGWARGLSKAGYATDPNYADKLIRIIEENQLFQLDDAEALAGRTSKPGSSIGYTLVRYNNDVRYVLSKEGETVGIIGSQNDISEKQLLRINDYAFALNQKLEKGRKIYLEPKRSRFHGRKKFHILQPGEDMLFIAQEYGIKLDALQKRNGIEGNVVPLPGQKIMLKGKPRQPLKTSDPYQVPEVQSPAPVKAETSFSASSSTGTVQSTSEHASGPINTHVVSRGDTLFSIAQSYRLSVEELKKRNNLSVDTIYIGQKLSVQ